MKLSTPQHGEERRYRKFALLPTRVVRCHRATGEWVWFGWMEVFEVYISDDDWGFGHWNGYGRVPAGEPLFLENCDEMGRHVVSEEKVSLRSIKALEKVDGCGN